MTISRRWLVGSGAGLTGLAAGPALAAADVTGVLSLVDMGIVPNSKRDLSKTLQTAIDRAIKKRTPLVFPGGTYIASGLTIDGPVQLIGVPGQTLLVSTDGNAILTLKDAKSVTVSGLGFDGADRLPAGDPWRLALLSAEGCEDLRIENCTLRRSKGSGLSLTACSGRIIGNQVGNIEKTGIFAFDSKGLEIAGNHLHDIGNNGIQIWRTDKLEDGSIVSHNRVERVAAKAGGSGQNGNGINVWKAGNVLISNNRISDCRYSAIRNNSGANCQILGNSISRTDEVAIFVEFAFDGAIVANNLIEDPALGISVTNLDHGGRLAVVSGNIIRNPRGGGVIPETSATGIAVEADTVVTGNLVENAPDTGIHLGWGPYAQSLSATGNTLLNCGTGISASLFEGARDVLIASNLISGARLAAILGMDHRTPVTGDLTLKDADIPPRIHLSGNVVT